MMDETTYLLKVLEEECNEVAIRCSKAIRFGLKETQPDTDEGDNAERIAYELDDLLAVRQMLINRGIIRKENLSKISIKVEKVIKFMQYSRERGILK
jgi:hypothetical protein